MRPGETSYPSPLDKPLHQLTDEDISQLTREDCRRYLMDKGMRRPSWNKSQAIQQVLSLKSLLETRSDSGAGSRQSVVSSRTENPPHHHHHMIPPPVSAAAEEPLSYRRKDPPKTSFPGSLSARLPSTDNNKPIPPNPNRITSETNEPVDQMTIFYHGMVNVYDDVPATKARAIMQLAGSSINLPQGTPSSVNTTIRPFPCLLQAASDRPGSSSLASSSTSVQTKKVAENTVQYREEGNMSHEFGPGPASRKASLQRYFEKRKDRGRFKSNRKIEESSCSSLGIYLKNQVKVKHPNRQSTQRGMRSPSQPSPPHTPTQFSSVENRAKDAALNDNGVKHARTCSGTGLVVGYTNPVPTFYRPYPPTCASNHV